MIPSNDIEQRSTEIRNLFGNGNLDNALNRLMDFIGDFDESDLRNEVTVIKVNFRDVETAARRKQLDFMEALEIKNKLLYQALALLDQVTESLAVEVH